MWLPFVGLGVMIGALYGYAIWLGNRDGPK